MRQEDDDKGPYIQDLETLPCVFHSSVLTALCFYIRLFIMPMSVHMCGLVYHDMCVGLRVVGVRSLSPPHGGPWDQTQVVKLGSQHLSPLSHLANSLLLFFFFKLHKVDTQVIAFNLALFLMEALGARSLISLRHALVRPSVFALLVSTYS